ncbi:hypothetical protein Tco_0847592 [Tanacetum coccineum]
MIMMSYDGGVYKGDGVDVAVVVLAEHGVMVVEWRIVSSGAAVVGGGDEGDGARSHWLFEGLSRVDTPFCMASPRLGDECYDDDDDGVKVVLWSRLVRRAGRTGGGVRNDVSGGE